MDRQPAYADAVAALLDAAPQDAVSRFDAELTAAIAAGLDPATARTLRWWQREATRALRDHASTVLPAVIDALVASERSRAEVTAEDGETEFSTAATGSEAPQTAPAAPSSEEARRRTLVAGLQALSEASA